MKKYLIAICLLGIAFLVYRFVSKPTFKKEYFDDGALKAYYPMHNDQVNGEAVEYFEDGAVKSRAIFKDGVQHGRAIFYYPGGIMRREAYFEFGIQQDTMKVYYENGNLMELSFLIDGVKNGRFEDYYENGNIKSRGTAKNNERDGEWVFYKPDASVDRFSFFREGNEVSNLIPTEGYYSYNNNIFNYSFSIPNSFKKAQEKQDYVLFTVNKEGFKPTINILTRQLDGVAFTAFVDKEIESIRNLTSGFKLIDRSKEGQMTNITYLAEYKGYKVKVSTSFIAQQKHVFLLTYMSEADTFQNHFSEMKMVLDTFTISDQKET